MSGTRDHDAWVAFLGLVEPFRPDLYRYCRGLTSNVWEAEDLIQDTLEQAYARTAYLGSDVLDVRAYILRIASNLWVSQIRREVLHRQMLEQQMLFGDVGELSDTDPAELAESVYEAGTQLIEQLAPQERAATLLKEVFEFSLKEIAAVLGTTTGAVKSALHRGRKRLRETAGGALTPRYDVSTSVVDEFVTRFNARDREGLISLMLDSAEVSMGGVVYEISADVIAREDGWLDHNLRDVDAVWESAVFHGEPIVAVLSKTLGHAVRSVMRLQSTEGMVSRIRVYAFCPDAVQEVAQGLNRSASPLGAYHVTREVARQLGR